MALLTEGIKYLQNWRLLGSRFSRAPCSLSGCDTFWTSGAEQHKTTFAIGFSIWLIKTDKNTYLTSATKTQPAQCIQTTYEGGTSRKLTEVFHLYLKGATIKGETQEAKRLPFNLISRLRISSISYFCPLKMQPLRGKSSAQY